ncbi:phage tail protein [Massilia sp.]|uniref:phage tail protein n=1 Tax=Massilia sp. TaxID=1882437 RepID=UPI0028AB765F|nr:tail fiber protein [Massilia sp.]
MFAGNFAPAGWELCQGQLLPIEEYDTLFMLIGTTYGGDGQTNFALPDLRGRVPVHVGGTTGNGTGLRQFALGGGGGVETVTLTPNQMPVHTHAVVATTDTAVSTYDATNGVPATVAATSVYGPVGTPGPMTANAIGTAAGGNQPHANMAPYLSVNFIISLFGIFPMQT